jgi:hypothetical protein
MLSFKQKYSLENRFQFNMYPSKDQFIEICKENDLSENQVRYWFNNRRAKKAGKKLSLSQIIFLLNEFNRNNHPNKDMILNIAKKSNMSSKQIRIWFKTKRINDFLKIKFIKPFLE